MYTRHGHHIPGTVKDYPLPEQVARCGGPKMCSVCAVEVSSHIEVDALGDNRVYSPSEEGEYMKKAKKIVQSYILSHLEATDTMPVFNVYVVWFAKVLQNWKALVSTTLPDGMYYEVTYNGDKNETYLDAYKKFNNKVIPD